MPYKLIIYDLDGTLLDAFEDIQRALNHGLKQCGFGERSLAEVKSYVGEGIRVLVERALGAGQSGGVDEVLPLVAGYYKNNPSATAEVYPGVIECLKQLHDQGYRQVILTNKPHQIAVEVCERVGLAGLVDRVQGAEENVPLKPDPEIALRLAAEFGLQPEECVVVGDGEPDVELARAAWMGIIGCAWGKHTREEIKAMGPDAVIETMDELPALLARQSLS